MPRRRLIGLAAGYAAVAVLLALGVWQVERLQWKRALIAQVERRLAAAPVAAPGPAQWPAIGKGDAYTRVRVTGRWAGRDVRVQAVTDLGGGYWVVTPLVTQQGWTVLVNRGFSPSPRSRGSSGRSCPRHDLNSAGRCSPDDGRGEGQEPRRDSRLGETPTPHPTLSPQAGRGLVEVQGLLRLTEPKGGFLRRNDPAAGRWYSRDVTAIAATQRLGTVAPYFIDADRRGDGWPRGGMTVLRFPNNHLVYALTWFGLAGLVAFLLWRVTRR